MSIDQVRDDQALPLTVVQPLAKKTAHTALYRRLVEEGLDEAAAQAIARAVVDPADARQRLDKLVPVRVPGGRLFSLDALVWAPGISNFPVNNREAMSRSFPAGGEAPSAEASRFRPLRPASDAPDGTHQLHQQADSPQHLVWSLERSVQYLLDHNSWVDSIAAQGVMVPVTTLPVTVKFGDGTPDATVLATGDGSSRMASAHEILGVSPKDVVLDLPADERRYRGFIAEVLSVVDRPAAETADTELQKVRALQVPARILLRFEPDSENGMGFAKAVESLVHLLHVEPATQWDEAASLDTKSDAVIAAMHEDGLLTPSKRAYADGMLTPREAREIGLGGEADERALWLLSLISAEKAAVKRAVRSGILELTKGKSVRKEAKAQIAVELGLRAVRVSHQAAHVKSARLALQNAFQSSLLWAAGIQPRPDLTPEQLRDAALAELEEHGEPREACARLAAQGGFWLAVHRALREAHFFQDREHRDGRSPQKILEALAGTSYGLRVLHRALVDGRDGQPPASIDVGGKTRRSNEGKALPMTSAWLRQDVVPAVAKPSTTLTQDAFPTRQLSIRVRALADAITNVEDAHRQLRSVMDSAGHALVDTEGINVQKVQQMSETLDSVSKKLSVYEALWTMRNSQEADDDALVSEPVFNELDDDPFGDGTGLGE